jgi:uncharacterized protein
MIRVVLDTNIVVSALLQPTGPPAQVFALALSDSIQICVSGPIYAEYEEVIRRPHLRRDEFTITSALRTIRERSLWFRPAETVLACVDKDDDVFLECAQAAQAEYLVTGNIKHFPPVWIGTRILTPRVFLDVLSATSAKE